MFGDRVQQIEELQAVLRVVLSIPPNQLRKPYVNPINCQRQTGGLHSVLLIVLHQSPTPADTKST